MTNLQHELLPMRLRESSGDEDLLKRPRQTHHTDKYFGSAATSLKKTKSKTTTGTAAEKKDGWTGALHLYEKGGKFFIKLVYRKDGFPHVCEHEIPAEPYLDTVKLAKYCPMWLLCEMLACVGGDTSQELGFTAVRKVLAQFVRNGMKNQGKHAAHLCLVLFGLGTLQPKSRAWTPQNDLASTYAFLQTLVRPNNKLISVVEYTQYEVQLHRDQLVFRTKGDRKLVADCHEAFVQFLLKKASAKGLEGFVFSFPEDVVQDKPGNTYVDTWGKHRARNGLKVKLELEGTYLASGVADEDKPDDATIFLFAQDEKNPGRLKYAADVSGHPIIKQKLGATKVPELDRKDKDLYNPLFENVRYASIQYKVTASGLSKNKYPLGIKCYGIKQVETDYTTLTVMSKLTLPHWEAVHEAHKRLSHAEADMLQADNDDDEDDMLKPVRPTKRAKPAAPRPGPAKPAAPRPAKSPEPEEEEEEEESEEEKSPKRQDTPEREEAKPKPVFRPRVFPKKTYKVFLHPNLPESDRDYLSQFIRESGAKLLDSLAPDVGIIVMTNVAIKIMNNSPSMICNGNDLKKLYPNAKIVTVTDAKALIIAGFHNA
jgi:hypothetical protein